MRRREVIKKMFEDGTGDAFIPSVSEEGEGKNEKLLNTRIGEMVRLHIEILKQVSIHKLLKDVSTA